ncbi:non-hydrolyzing UDP-N-acetylglucosamine 2-epimerase [Desulfomicrobium escambiense]|uniref:non-hydrolyzing UDP-N-acetylglucosamine 2-epimerase n=1 Tax=Desulfomicrobium escambiense TaxID=29503 RepID=UPI00048A799D|nr:UDP-N-acetylglucosamine 2-epimerase (non-hydrolyzing) [Desulfomicrobium escambiense]
MKTKILVAFGTRPEAIKMAPVVNELRKRVDDFVVNVCVTAQHREMLDQVLRLFQITPDCDLDIMKPGQDLYDVTSRVLVGVRDLLCSMSPDIVLVHGDTTTSMAVSLAAYYNKTKVGHVEAGLRTYDKYSPFPEEINRRFVDMISDMHFAPTEESKNNLLHEGVDPSSVHVTGNTVIDALLLVRDMIFECADMKRRLEERFGFLDTSKRLILVTGHRRENFGAGFENICNAIREISVRFDDVEVVYPVHLNPNVREPVYRILGSDRPSNVHLIGPLDYLPFTYLMDRSFMIMTDSGGVQEEAPSLGKPVLVLRDVTERPEAVLAGTVRLVGTSRSAIVEQASLLLSDQDEYSKMARSHNPYGDGMASRRIAKILGVRVRGMQP